jgi:hypothetical protein
MTMKNFARSTSSYPTAVASTLRAHLADIIERFLKIPLSV